ncbi:PRC-barrel domain-containing protein (plasmid) [Aliirhizobium terrae]|uniref:PRC-barrel domain-containing protein n=1 Tax=Terrirhizobium terrae TaxID=2926709 RepID=UPI002576DEFC|nr:PRC-barrel domain-containing protein [Rhizobium sp. CC-CFT758]WJH38817.1 PRC-barrel domain-containing protein [Rhizobium sp. CC-CFT758]
MMRLEATDLLGSSIRAADGDAGTVSDILFDDQSLAIRWVVVRTGSWLSEEQVLVRPQNLLRSEADPRIWETGLAIDDFRKARPLEDDLPVSLQRLREAKVESGISPFRIAPLGMPPVVRLHSWPTGDQHLRSINHVRGYDIQTDIGTFGRVANFIIALPEWTIVQIEISQSDGQEPQFKALKPPFHIDADRKVVDLSNVAGKAATLHDQSSSGSLKAGRRPFGY